jgi:prenyl protein peptidase
MEQGPISEEIIWRGILIPLHLLAGFSGKETIFLTPLYFGIAHFHHMYEFRVRNPDAPLIVAVARSLVQFTYTSLFGFFAAFIFLRTGNIYAAMLAHTFCNWMGLPRLWGRVGVAAGAPIGPPDVGYPEGGDRGDGSKSLGWTVAYYVILFAGAYGFYKGLFPLTDSSNALPVVLLGE